MFKQSFNLRIHERVQLGTNLNYDIGAQTAELQQALLTYPRTQTEYDALTKSVTTCYSLTGWSGSGMTLNTTDKYDGNNTIKLNHNVGGASPYCYRTLPSALDLSAANYIDLYLYLPSYATSNFTLRLSTDAPNYYRFVINPNYISGIVFSDMAFGWRRVRIPKSSAIVTGSPNWNNINLFEFDTSYPADAAGYISIAKIDAVETTTGLISIDFDDNMKSVYDLAKPILDNYNLKATVYAITNSVGSANRMNWNNLNSLRKSGWIIGSHTHTHPNLTTIAEQDILNEYNTSQSLLRSHGHVVGANFLAAPFGAINQLSLDLAKTKFLSARYTFSPIPENEIPLRSKFQIDYLSVANSTSVASLKAKVDDIIAKKYHHVFTFHDIATPADTATKYTAANFDEFCAYVRTKVDAGLLGVLTVKDLIF